MSFDWNHQPSTPPLAPPLAPPPAPPTATGPSWRPPNPPPSPPEPPARRRRGGRTFAVVLVVAVLLVAGFAIGRLTLAPGGEDAVVAADPGGQVQQTSQEPPVPAEVDEPVAAVAEAVSPAVVQIETSAGLGSGVVFDESGLVLTNAHVVGDDDQVVVRQADGSSVDGEVLGADPSTDVAVVQIDSDAVLGTACLALGEEVRVGQIAVAIGSPFGLDQTVTSGIVSAVERPFPNSDVVVGMIQTDAPINSGNSGGAVGQP